MTNSISNIALQAVVIIALTGFIGAVLFNFADYATSGVIA